MRDVEEVALLDHCQAGLAVTFIMGGVSYGVLCWNGKSPKSGEELWATGLVGINHENNICAHFAQIQSRPVNVWAVNRATQQQFFDQSNSMDDWTLWSVCGQCTHCLCQEVLGAGIGRSQMIFRHNCNTGASNTPTSCRYASHVSEKHCWRTVSLSTCLL